MHMSIPNSLTVPFPHKRCSLDPKEKVGSKYKSFCSLLSILGNFHDSGKEAVISVRT